MSQTRARACRTRIWLMFVLATAGCTGRIGDSRSGVTPMVGALGSRGSAGAATGSNTGSAGAGIGGPLDICFSPVGRLNRTPFNHNDLVFLRPELNPPATFPTTETYI